MYRTAVTLTLLSLATAFASSACSSGNIPVGASQSQSMLQKKKDGTPTGNGTTCSWDDSVSSDGTITPSRGAAYKNGDIFASLDGCNECSCTAQGIACTERTCAPPALDVCSYGGKGYAAGASFPSTDGCNECSCGANGAVSCTERACAPATCPATAPTAGAACAAVVGPCTYPGVGGWLQRVCHCQKSTWGCVDQSPEAPPQQ